MDHQQEIAKLKARARKLQEARQMWRLCAAAEVVLSEHGVATTVAHVLKAAGMSRRSFYEWFTSLENLIEDMCAVHHETGGYGPHARWYLLAKRPVAAVDAAEAFAHALAVYGTSPRPVPPTNELLAWFNRERMVVAPVAPEQPHFCWSTNGEKFDDELFNTADQAFDAWVAAHDPEAGDIVHIGVAHRSPSAGECCPGHYVDDMSQFAHDNYGECSDEWPDSTKEQNEELDVAIAGVVEDWATKHGHQPKFYEISEVEQREYQPAATEAAQ